MMLHREPEMSWLIMVPQPLPGELRRINNVFAVHAVLQHCDACSDMSIDRDREQQMRKVVHYIQQLDQALEMV